MPGTHYGLCYRLLKTVSTYWSLAFLDDRGFPRNPSEVAWFGLFISEPALIEASMAICERHWYPDTLYKWRSEIHRNAAFNIVIERIQSRQAQTDGVLGAVLTMAFGERLVGNDLAWNVHIDGLAQIIKDRHSRGIFVLPPWFSSLLVLSVSPSCSRRT